MSRRFWNGVAVFAACCLAVETGARMMGIGDYALYEASDTVGYIPKPSQAGAFLNRYRWVFNERSMGVSTPFRPAPKDILLIGDSIVLGGNQVDQPNKLGPALSRMTGCTTWPISAGSWGLLNELRVLESNPDFLKVGTIVFVSNSGDFNAASIWQNGFTHPRNRPVLISLFAASKYLYGTVDRTNLRDADAVRVDWKTELAAFFRRYSGRVVWVLYPQREELAAPSGAFAPLKAAVHGKAEIINVDEDRRWNTGIYKDYIHPTDAGTRTLASIISVRMPRCR